MLVSRSVSTNNMSCHEIMQRTIIKCMHRSAIEENKEKECSLVKYLRTTKESHAYVQHNCFTIQSIINLLFVKPIWICK